MYKKFEITFTDLKSGNEESLIIVPYKGKGINKLPVSRLSQIESVIHSSNDGIEEVEGHLNIKCNDEKREEIIRNLNDLAEDQLVIRNYYKLQMIVICVFYFWRKYKMNHKIIAGHVGLEKSRTVKTILTYREELMNLNILSEFDEEWDDKYGYLTDEIVYALAEIVRKELKDPKQSFK